MGRDMTEELPVRFALISLFLLMIPGVAAAQGTGVFPVEGVNLNEGELNAIGVLLATAYESHSGSPVLKPSVTGPALQQAGSARDAAAQLGLSEYITTEAVRLDTRIVVTAVRRNRHGSELFRVQQTATSLDDMQPVADRVAGALYRRTEVEHTRTLDNVTGMEARRPNRMFAEKVFGARVGLVVPLAKHLQTEPTVLAQFDGRLEGTNYFLEFAGGIMLPSDLSSDDDAYGGLVGHVGASYYLTHTSVSPYVGAGLSPRIVFGEYQGVGLTANAHLGLMFMRHSSSRIYVEVQVDQNLLGLRPDNDYYYEDFSSEPVTRDKVWPTELSLAVGIGW